MDKVGLALRDERTLSNNQTFFPTHFHIWSDRPAFLKANQESIDLLSGDRVRIEGS